MDRADDAKIRLSALHQPIPRPTKGDVARNRAELASRGEATAVQRVMELVKKGPDVANAVRVGDPPLVDPEPIAATSVVRSETFSAMGLPDKGSSSGVVGIDILNPTQPAAPAPAADANATGGLPFGHLPAAAASGSDPNELKPNAPDPNELKPIESGTDAALPPPTQVNEIQPGQALASSSSSSSSAKAGSDSSAPASDADLSSSKKKKKKGLKKLIPF